jgi:hypothetical protein
MQANSTLRPLYFDSMANAFGAPVPGVRASVNQYLSSGPATWLNGTPVFVVAVVTKHNPSSIRFQNGPISVRSSSSNANNDWWVFPYQGSNCLGMQRKQNGVLQDYFIANPPMILKESIAGRTAYIPQFQGHNNRHGLFTRDAPVYLNQEPYLIAVVAQKKSGSPAQFLSILRTDTYLGNSWGDADSSILLHGHLWAYHQHNEKITLYLIWKEGLTKQHVFRVNGQKFTTEFSSNTYLSVPNTLYTTLSINDRWSHNAPVMFGKIYEIMVLTGPLKEPHHRIIEGYLAWKWGLEKSLPRRHPYYRVPPGK